MESILNKPSLLTIMPAHVKPELVLQGLELVSARVASLSTELTILNNWMKELPSLIEAGESETIHLRDIRKVLERMTGNQDSLSDQFARMNQVMKTLMQYLDIHNQPTK